MSDDEETGLTELYRELDDELARANPRCEASGRCCRFAEYGHTLFLSRIEAEYLLAGPAPQGVGDGYSGCPYQVGRLCTARERRPLGCRVYYCDPTFAERMVSLSEAMIRKLKNLHERVGRGWEYRPLAAFLAERPPQDGSRPGVTGPLPIVEIA